MSESLPIVLPVLAGLSVLAYVVYALDWHVRKRLPAVPTPLSRSPGGGNRTAVHSS